MDISNYKNEAAYPKRENFNLYRYSIVDSESFIILANTTALSTSIGQSVDEMVLNFLRENKPNAANPIVYAEYGPHVWDYPLTERTKLDAHKLKGSNIRFYRKNTEEEKKRSRKRGDINNPIAKWEYLDDSVFVQIDTIFLEDKYREAQKAYRLGEQQMRDRFKKDLFKELGIADHPNREKLWEKAWDDRHSEGLQAVYEEAEELSELMA